MCYGVCRTFTCLTSFLGLTAGVVDLTDNEIAEIPESICTANITKLILNNNRFAKHTRCLMVQSTEYCRRNRSVPFPPGVVAGKQQIISDAHAQNNGKHERAPYANP